MERGRDLGGTCLFVQRPQAARAKIDLARQTGLINRRPLNIEPEHPVGPALRVTHIVAEARPSTADVTLTSHRTPLYQRYCSNEGRTNVQSSPQINEPAAHELVAYHAAQPLLKECDTMMPVDRFKELVRAWFAGLTTGRTNRLDTLSPRRLTYPYEQTAR